MGKKSRDKGKRGELEWRDRLRTYGYVGAERGAQRSGSPDSPDVKVPSLAGLVHFEVKRAERLSLWSALNQATDEAGEAMPVVAHRPNGKPWVCVLRGEDLLWLLTREWPPTGNATERALERFDELWRLEMARGEREYDERVDKALSALFAALGMENDDE